ncbi:FecR family protein [Poseidonibacter lekithochrous]|uniref:FecR family protein n=1 Tax=Poseidonibacter lekithochrous TaxID=1904463 RepID=UPI000D3A15F4|nr:FecR family protein [Poseidonibacter lekithochrous]
MKYLLLFLLFFSSLFASIGKVSAVVGDAKIERGNKNIVVKIGIPLFEKDIIRTKKNAKVQLIFKDNTIVTIGKNSALDINTYLYDKKNPKNSKTDLNFFKGAFKTITGKIGKINREKFKLRTKSASIGIRGTIILGNQSVIACTQGGISVESAGITVEVDANELTKVEENKAPSKAENITNNDLNSLEESLEPLDEASSENSNTEEEESSSSDESETNENSSSDDESENSEKSKDTENSESTESSENSETQNDNSDNSDTSNDENSISSNTLKTEEALNTDVESAEEEAAKIAAQKQAEELAVYTKKTEEVKKAIETINTLKTEVTQTQVETQNVLKNLPSTDAVTTFQSNSTQTLSTVNTEVTTAVNNLKDELGSISSTQSVQSFFSFSFFSSNSVSTQSSSSIETQSNKTSLEKAVELQADAQTKHDKIKNFRNSQNIDANNLAISSAKIKVDSAKASLDESFDQLELAKKALQDANTAGISSTYTSAIQKNVDEAQSAYDSVNEAYTMANDLYENKVQALKDIETSFKKASNGLDKAKLNVEVIKIKDYLEIIKSSKTNTDTYKHEVVGLKSNIENEINSLTSQSETSTLKTNTDNAKTTTDSSINTAVSQLQSSTTNVITDDALANIVSLFNQTSGNTDLLNESTALKSDIVTSDNLAALNIAKAELKKATTALDNSEIEYNNALKNKKDLRTAFDSVIELENNIKKAKELETDDDLAKELGLNSEVSKLKTSSINKADSDFNEAQTAYNEAQIAHSSAQTLYNDKQKAYDEANESYSNAQEAVNDALVLGKLKDLLVKVDESSDSKTNASTNKDTVLSSKTSIENGINSLISQSQTSTLKTNTDTAKTTTDSSINTAVSQLQSSTTNVITDDALANIVSLFNQTSGNTDLLNQSTTLKNSAVTSENLNALNSANEALASASAALENTQTQYQNAQNAYTEIQGLFESNGTYNGSISEELKTSLLSKALSDLNSAQSAHSEAQSAYTSAQALYEDKKNAYDEANESYTNAQEAVNDALVLGKLLDLIKFMDLASDNKSTAVSEKTNTLTFQSQINTIINTLPTDEDLINKDINTETKLENTNTAINSAIATLVGATETSSVAPSELSSLSTSASSTLSNNETLLASAESFKNSVDNEYKNSLDSATVKLNSAKTHRDNSKQALDIAKQALVDFNASFSTNEDNFDSQVSDTLKNSLISKLNSDISQAQSAFDEANTAYNLVENEISTKREDLNISANNSLEQAQVAVSLAQDLGKLSDMLGYIDTANKGNANATVSKTDAINAKNIVLSKISTLPSSTEIQAEENVASSALTTTRTSLTSAINAINTASNSESVNADDVGNVSMSANNLKSSNTTVLANAQTFKTKVTEGEYKTTLDETAVKVAVALSAKQSAETAKNSAHLAMTNMNNILALFTSDESEESGESEISDIVIISNGENSPPPNESESEDGTLSTSSTSIVLTAELIEILQGKLQSEYDSAKEAYDDAEEAYDLAKSDYDNKNASLNNAATSSVSDAQTAVNETNLLEDLSDLLTSLENTKEAKINVLIEKDKLVDAKAQTVSANTNATNANTNILAFKSDAADAKTASLTASSDSTAASLIANNVETENVQIAYSAKIAVDKVDLAKNKADHASAAAANASTQYNNLVAFTNTMNNELSKSLTAKDKAYTDYQTALAQLAITKAKKIEIDAVSNTLASQAAVNAVNKAQALYDLALQSYNDANQLYTDTKKIVDDLNITTYLANAETKKNKASSDAAEAQTAYNSALVEAVKADTSSKQASLRVKNIMLALNTKQVASDTTESNLGLDNKLFELSGVKTNETLIPTAIGAYLGHTQIGVFKEDINSANPLYLVQADNLQEYFVGYSDSSNSDKTLFTYGVDTNNNFDASKINVYKNFKTLKVNTDGTKVLSNDNTLAYYNPVTKSFTTFSKDVFKDGAKNFTAGDAETFNTQENTFNFNSNGFTVSSVDITESTGSSKFLGSVEQGLTQTSQNNAITNTSVDGQTASVSTKISDDMSASFLDSQMDVEPLEASRSMSGSVVLLTNSGTAGTTRHENIEMTISNNSKNEVHIIADAKYENGNTIKRYGGYVNDQKAYYINSDIFGVKVEEPTPSEKGFLIAVPDGGYNQANEFVMYDENDNPLTSNDDSSWGYWSGTNSFNDGNGIVSINPLATWVAGVKTSSTYMDALFNGANQNLEFNGKVLGTIGYQDSILMDSTNKVRINFDIGGGSKNMTGNMQFKSATSNLYNVDLAVNSDSISNSSFTGGFKPANNPDAATSGYIKGEYYGGSTLKSIGGTFQVDQHGATANGVFKATKK